MNSSASLSRSFSRNGNGSRQIKKLRSPRWGEVPEVPLSGTTVGAVRPDLLAGVGEIEHSVPLLTVMHGRDRRTPFADQLVRLVYAEMVKSVGCGAAAVGLCRPG
jgi:hypothetical protein